MLRRSVVGRWRVLVSPLCIQEEVLAAGIEVSVAIVGNVYGLISFRTTALRDSAMENNPEWFMKWFLDAKSWEMSNLISPTHRWFCLKGIPLPY